MRTDGTMAPLHLTPSKMTTVDKTNDCGKLVQVGNLKESYITTTCLCFFRSFSLRRSNDLETWINVTRQVMRFMLLLRFIEHFHHRSSNLLTSIGVVRTSEWLTHQTDQGPPSSFPPRVFYLDERHLLKVGTLGSHSLSGLSLASSFLLPLSCQTPIFINFLFLISFKSLSTFPPALAPLFKI